ncbi:MULTISPECIES: hypothetical protein [Aphanizomenonaceae]|uniref:Uncharacterized protein n=1 Tax=Dolichospermum heterosporum TAC447 TaxID=747523 RepID=A0ABY5LTP1_9CYAN|nr:MULTISPECIES: hypothetical protein [Aphanizomenonaceae]MBE9257595.1 hypothetical protein [Dolichospermum sp. LEGE 00246]MDK2409119.1 hypothetical protein [Aphanizomenon sp. 202]MDK2460179.1 hypothetical protein [Aphanizomenon sp. PH219]UUO14117.1 hypothetical protein NG743_18990 [Dolichospermum heterosporum TAC447]
MYFINYLGVVGIWSGNFLLMPIAIAIRKSGNQLLCTCVENNGFYSYIRWRSQEVQNLD